MKRITIIPATGGTYSDLTIKPGTTPRDVKRQLGLADTYVLTRGQGTEPLADDANLFELLADGSKVYATTDVEVGK